MKAAVHLGPMYSENLVVYKNTNFEEIQILFCITQNLISGPLWRESEGKTNWEQNSLMDEVYAVPWSSDQVDKSRSICLIQTRVDSTPCRTHIFLSLVGPSSVSHCTWHFPLAHMWAWLKTCRGRVVWTSAHSSKVILSRHASTSFDRCPWLFLILLYLTASTDNLTPADGSQANQEALLRSEGCCLALWPNTTLSQVMSPTPGSKSAVITLRSTTRLMSTASNTRPYRHSRSLREPWRFSAASGSQQ